MVGFIDHVTGKVECQNSEAFDQIEWMGKESSWINIRENKLN